MYVVIVAGIAIFAGIAELLKYLRVCKYGLIAAAVVTEVTSYGRRSRYDDVYVAFRTVDGQQATAEQDGAAGVYRVGDEIEIIYLSNDPEKIYWSAGKKSLIISLFLIVMSVVLLVLEFGDII